MEGKQSAEQFSVVWQGRCAYVHSEQNSKCVHTQFPSSESTKTMPDAAARPSGELLVCVCVREPTHSSLGPTVRTMCTHWPVSARIFRRMSKESESRARIREPLGRKLAPLLLLAPPQVKLHPESFASSSSADAKAKEERERERRRRRRGDYNKLFSLSTLVDE